MSLVLAMVATATLSASKADLYRLAAEATAQAESERVALTRCRGDLADEWGRREELEVEVARLRVDLSSRLPVPAQASPSRWPAVGAILGAGSGAAAGLLGGIAVAERSEVSPGIPAVVGAALGAAAGAGLGLLVGWIVDGL